MDRTKLDHKAHAAVDRLNAALAELEALVVQKKISKTFQSTLQGAIVAYHKATTAVIKALDKQAATRGQASSEENLDYVHGRGHSMTAAGTTERFHQVHITYKHPSVDGKQGEWLWARIIGNYTAKLDSIPFFSDDLALGDLVRFNAAGEVTAVLEHGARTRQLKYGDPAKQSVSQLQKKYSALQAKLEPYDIVTEPMGPGLSCLSVPEDVDDSQLAILVAQTGAQLLNAENLKQGPQDAAES